MIKRLCEINKLTKQGTIHDEMQYLNLIRDILDNGVDVNGRNGETRAIYGAVMHFDLSKKTLPLLTTKKVAWKTCLKELLWFISGKTDNNILQSNNVKIWNENASREFLDKQGLVCNREGDLGPVYGHQWRHFNASYTDCDTDYTGKGIDQLQNIVELLSNPETRTSRRIIMSAWNPCQLSQMALPPCHVMCQFNVFNDKLSCTLYQRSADVGLGLPFNIASYAFLTHLVAHHCNLEASELIINIGNAHIYSDHIDILREQLDRDVYNFPKIDIIDSQDCDEIQDYTIDNVKVLDYRSHKILKMIMRP